MIICGAYNVFGMEMKQKDCFKNFEKPRIKRLKNIDFLYELLFYDELIIEKIPKAFKGYARSYKIEIIDWKDPFLQLEASQPSIKDLLKEILDEITGFKYQITLKVLLSKHKENKDLEFAPIYFNSATKIHHERKRNANENIINDLDYEGIEFPPFLKDFGKIEKKNNIYINLFCYGNNLVYPVHISDKYLDNCIDLLMIRDENKSH